MFWILARTAADRNSSASAWGVSQPKGAQPAAASQQERPPTLQDVCLIMRMLLDPTFAISPGCLVLFYKYASGLVVFRAVTLLGTGHVCGAVLATARYIQQLREAGARRR